MLGLVRVLVNKEVPGVVPLIKTMNGVASAFRRTLRFLANLSAELLPLNLDGDVCYVIDASLTAIG